MTDRNPLSDQNGTPEDVATLYSWANLHGAKYRDFSASRAQSRELTRLRAEQALQEAELRDQHEAEISQAAEAQGGASPWQAPVQAPVQAPLPEAPSEQASRPAETESQPAAEPAAKLEAEQAAQQAQQRAAQMAELEAVRVAAERAAQQIAQQRAWQQPQSYDYERYAPREAHRPAAEQRMAQPPLSTPWEDRAREGGSLPRSPWATPDVREPAGRPAWLGSENATTPNPPVPPSSFPQAPEDTLQGSRDRLTSRWYALRGVFDAGFAPVEAAPAPAAAISRAPALAVFSLAGGVGKTSLVATLGRALSARGERVLLVDTAAFGLLPFFFGATDQRPGLLRTFTPPGASSDAPIQMVTLDPEGRGPDGPGQETLSGDILKFARGAGRVIVDLATASGATTRRIMRMSPMVLVPVVPDMNSVVSVSSIDAFFEHTTSPAGRPALPFYVLNQFDSSLPLHLDVREVLREQLGERLLPFALRRTPAMSEALAEGMTVMDYAPSSPLAEDFATLAGWVKSLSAPAASSYRGVRWSER
jgi:cellulose synthase operon protein YhjQ